MDFKPLSPPHRPLAPNPNNQLSPTRVQPGGAPRGVGQRPREDKPFGPISVWDITRVSGPSKELDAAGEPERAMGSPAIFDIELALSPPALTPAVRARAGLGESADTGADGHPGVSLSLATRAGVMARAARNTRYAQRREVARQERLRQQPTRRQVGFQLGDGSAEAKSER